MIVVEIVGALAYFHSVTFMPIILKDVKTTNTLLNDNFMAKSVLSDSSWSNTIKHYGAMNFRALGLKILP